MSAPRAAFRYSLLGPDDIEAVMRVETRCFDSPWTPGQFRHEIKVPFSRTILAWDDAAVPSCLAGYICRWTIGDEVSILNVAVDPAYQRKRLGQALLDLVLEEAVTQNASFITLEVRENNAAARGLYTNRGFLQTGLRRNYYGKNEHAVIMTRRLRPEGHPEDALCPNPDGRV